jgi:hypothetical protein
VVPVPSYYDSMIRQERLKKRLCVGVYTAYVYDVYMYVGTHVCTANKFHPKTKLYFVGE